MLPDIFFIFRKTPKRYTELQLLRDRWTNMLHYFEWDMKSYNSCRKFHKRQKLSVWKGKRKVKPIFNYKLTMVFKMHSKINYTNILQTNSQQVEIQNSLQIDGNLKIMYYYILKTLSVSVKSYNFLKKFCKVSKQFIKKKKIAHRKKNLFHKKLYPRIFIFHVNWK